MVFEEPNTSIQKQASFLAVKNKKIFLCFYEVNLLIKTLNLIEKKKLFYPYFILLRIFLITYL
jgi:hypothetical protein